MLVCSLPISWAHLIALWLWDNDVWDDSCLPSHSVLLCSTVHELIRSYVSRVKGFNFRTDKIDAAGAMLPDLPTSVSWPRAGLMATTWEVNAYTHMMNCIASADAGSQSRATWVAKHLVNGNKVQILFTAFEGLVCKCRSRCLNFKCLKFMC